MSDRKIVQIAAVPDGKYSKPCLFALSDSGEIWGLIFSTTNSEELKWGKLPPIPQEGNNDER